MNAREQIFVLDVNSEGNAYRKMTLNEAAIVETGIVTTLTTMNAMTLLQELITPGTLPIVMMLQWKTSGNHCQAVAYDNERYKCYGEPIEVLARTRNDILTKNGRRALYADPYDARQTTKAAATELKAIQRAVATGRTGLGPTPEVDAELKGTLMATQQTD